MLTTKIIFHFCDLFASKKHTSSMFFFVGSHSLEISLRHAPLIFSKISLKDIINCYSTKLYLIVSLDMRLLVNCLLISLYISVNANSVFQQAPGGSYCKTICNAAECDEVWIASSTFHYPIFKLLGCVSIFKYCFSVVSWFVLSSYLKGGDNFLQGRGLDHSSELKKGQLKHQSR